MNHLVPTDLQAAVVGVGGLQRLGRRRRRIGEPGLDIGKGGGAVFLQREEVVTAALQHEARRLALAMDRVSGDEHALQIDDGEKGAGGGDLVAALRNRRLAEHQPGLAGKGAHHVQRALTRSPVKRTPERFAINGDYAGTIGSEIVEEL